MSVCVCSTQIVTRTSVHRISNMTYRVVVFDLRQSSHLPYTSGSMSQKSDESQAQKGFLSHPTILCWSPDWQQAVIPEKGPTQRSRVLHQPRVRTENTTVSDETQSQQGLLCAPIHMGCLLMSCSPTDMFCFFLKKNKCSCFPTKFYHKCSRFRF